MGFYQQDNLWAAMAWSLNTTEAPERVENELPTSQGQGVDAPLNQPSSTLALRLAVAVAPYWWSAGQWIEAREWLERALKANGTEPTSYRAKALLWAGKLAFYRRDIALARHYHTEALAVFEQVGDTGQAASVLGDLGVLEVLDGNLESARKLLERRLLGAREACDSRAIAACLNNLGEVACRQRDFERAHDLFQACIDAGRASGSISYVAMGLYGVGSTSVRMGSPDAARPLLEESLALFRAVPEVPRVAELLVVLGRVTGDLGDYEASGRCLREAITLWHELGSRQAVMEVVECFVELALQLHQPERAARLLGATQSHTVTSSARENLVTRARAALGASAFEVAWALGSALSLEQAEALCVDP
jgi:tetratricopeptide (TPR) repeat protein